MNHQSQLVKNTIIIAIGKISTQIISYLLLPLFTKMLTPEDYGAYDFICTLAIFICPLITLLMEESMFRFMIDAKDEIEKKNIITQVLIYSGFATLIFVPIALFVMSISNVYDTFSKFLIIFFVISNIVLALSNSVARGEGKVRLYSISNFVLGISTIILNIVFVLLYKNANSLLLANTIANIGAALFLFIKLKLFKNFGKYDPSLMKKLIKYSVPLVPNSLSWTIINMSDRILLTQISGVSMNGIYAMASKFPNIVNVVYGYFYSAWKESAARIIKDETSTKIYTNIYHDIKRLLFTITLLLIGIMPFIFNIFINEQYEEAFIYIPIIIIATYYANLSSFIGGIFTALKKTKIIGVTTVIGAIINLVVDLVLIWKINIYAACISTLVANLVIYFYRKQKLKHYVKLRDLQMVGPGILLVLICVVYYLKYIPNFSMITYYTVNTIVFSLIIAYSIGVNKKIVNTIVNKIKRR